MTQDRGPNIHLYIERLILDGWPVERGQGQHIQAALEAELSDLLTQNGLAQNLQVNTAVPSVRGDVMYLGSDNNLTQMGTQIAQSVYSAIGNIR
jgi:hypothetical protein